MASTSHEGARAVFIKLEGTLLKFGLAKQVSFLVANSQKISDRLFKLAAISLALPFSSALGGANADLKLRSLALALRGMSQDRIEVLAEEYADRHHEAELIPGAQDFFKQFSGENFRIVFLSEGLDPFLRPLLARLELPGPLFCNRLEYQDYRATGNLVEPVIGARPWKLTESMEIWSEGIPLDRCSAYASAGGDIPLLEKVGKPCAVNPDLGLRRAANEMHWPIMEF